MNLMSVIIKNKFVVGLVATVIVYLFFIRPMFANKDKSLLVDRIKNKKVNNNNLTITDKAAEDLAANMYGEMKGFNWGADIQFWLDVMDVVKTKDDALLISKYFGVHDNQTLIEWLKSETSISFLYFSKLLIKKFEL